MASTMRFFSSTPFQEAFRLNAPSNRKVRLVQAMWLFGAAIAVIWGTMLNDVPEEGPIAITIAAVPSQGPVVAEVEESRD